MMAIFTAKCVETGKTLHKRYANTDGMTALQRMRVAEIASEKACTRFGVDKRDVWVVESDPKSGFATEKYYPEV